jgi:hypothetical protein
MPTNADLGFAVRRLRRERHHTIEDLAFEAEMHPTYLWASSEASATRPGSSSVHWPTPSA